MNQSTPSLDLPPALSRLLGMPAVGGAIPKYAAGGMVGPGGAPQPTSAGVSQTPQQGKPMDPQMLDMQVNQFAAQNPEQVAQIRNTIMQEMQTGELTQQELNMVVQLATVAARNPEMYPYVRKFAIQQGIATEQDLPQQYDQGLVFILLLAARAVQQDMGGQNMMQGGSPAAGQTAMPSMAKGGPVPQSAKSDGGVIIEAHEGEYVIPKKVVEMKGKEFFDSLVQKYKDL
jgi:hypothetical protein